MIYEISDLISRYKYKGILVDTNILLLYFVGTIRRTRISQFGRTKQFTPQDFDLLILFLSDFATMATTQSILTEVSNFIDKLGEPERTDCYGLLAVEISSLQESCIPSRDIASTEWPFAAFGLTDCGIVETAKRHQYLVLTDDLKVANFLRSEGVDTINFNDLRFIAQS